MSRGNKGIRDVVKDTRIGGSEIRPASNGPTILPAVNGNTSTLANSLIHIGSNGSSLLKQKQQNYMGGGMDDIYNG